MNEKTDATSGATSPRILLVDDDADLRETLRLGLLRLGYDVDTAVNGVQAAKRLGERVPDVVLLDIVMPEKDGLETLMALRRQHASVKVIAMSGGGRIGSRDYLAMAKLMGAHAMLSKPFSLQEVNDAVRSVLGGTGARPPA